MVTNFNTYFILSAKFQFAIINSIASNIDYRDYKTVHTYIYKYFLIYILIDVCIQDTFIMLNI